MSTKINPTSQTLLIEHAVTVDCEDGQPWPPALMDGWHLVHSTGGTTLWRRITLADTATRPAPVDGRQTSIIPGIDPVPPGPDIPDADMGGE